MNNQPCKALTWGLVLLSIAGYLITASPIVSAMSCGSETSTGTGNVAPMIVDGFPCKAGGVEGAINAPQIPYVSVKVCAPGSTTKCQVIDHIIVDTGSTGLRLAYSALNSSLRPGASGLPLVPGSSKTRTLTECETYVSSYAYGPIVKADVYIAGETAKSTQLQVFGDPKYPVPAYCRQQGGTETDTTQSFGGNGLIGVSFDLLDDYALYYNCNNSNPRICNPESAYPGIPNTVSQFASENNGVVLSLPAVGPTASTSPVIGTLTFGVSTQPNNTPSTGTLGLINDGGNDINNGTFSAMVGGSWFTAYIDSGTDVVYFNDPKNPSLTYCPTSGPWGGWYCPSIEQNLTFALADSGTIQTKAHLSYSVANASNVITPYTIAYSNVAGPDGSTITTNSSIGFGLSSFFGNRMYFLFTGKMALGSGFGFAGQVTGPINGIESPNIY
jgi:Protein of unknown function (DUF3443)